MEFLFLQTLHFLKWDKHFKLIQNIFVFIRNVLFKINILNSNFYPKKGRDSSDKTFPTKGQKILKNFFLLGGPLNY